MGKDKKGRISKLLSALASRKTIEKEDDVERVIREDEIRTKIKNNIKDAVSRLEPGASIFKCFWLIGEPGAGKTQSLLGIAHDLKENITDAEKIAISKVDIVLENASRLSDIEKKIFLNSFASSSTAENKAKELIKDISNSFQKTGEATEKFLGFGLEVSQIWSLSLPPFVGPVSMLTFNIASDRLKTSSWNIRRSLLEKNPEWGNDREALDFMVNWVSYCFKPTSERWRELKNLSEKYSEQEGLFTFLCKLLRKAKFSTFIILLDEVSDLEPGQISRLLRLLRDKSADMNIIVICTGLPAIRKTFEEDEQLRRRFWYEKDVFTLSKPIVKPNDDSQDDFSFAKNRIIELCGKMNQEPKKPEKKDEIELRLKLIDEKEKPLTWSTLWEGVSDLFNPKD